MNVILTLILSIVFWPITLIGSWVIVHPFEEIVVVRWGKLDRVLKEQGIHWVNLWGRQLRKVSLTRQALELPKNTVADGNGNPIIISGIVTFSFKNAEKAALAVTDAHDFVRSQAQAVLKQVASQYPYESKDGHSLKSEAGLIGPELVRALEKKVEPAGASVFSFELSDLTYAPEIAQSMLIRQQAMALIDARKTIVEGAVEIVREAVEMLEARDLAIAGDARTRLVTNLLTVICGDAKVTPTISIAADERHDAQGAEALTRVAAQLERIAKSLPHA